MENLIPIDKVEQEDNKINDEDEVCFEMIKLEQNYFNYEGNTPEFNSSDDDENKMMEFTYIKVENQTDVRIASTEEERDPLALNPNTEIKVELLPSAVAHTTCSSTSQGTGVLLNCEKTDGRCVEFIHNRMGYPYLETEEITERTNVNVTKCRSCSSLESRNVNKKIIHIGEKPYKCSKCDYMAAQFHDLRTHLKVHNKGRKFKCNLCNYETSQESYFNKHAIAHTTDTPYKCSLCDYSIYKLGMLKIHKKLHCPEQSHDYMVNNYFTAGQSDLIKYKNSHNKEKLLTSAEFVNKPSSSDYAMKNTVYIFEKPYKCEKCDYSSSRQRDFIKHKNIHRKEETSRNLYFNNTALNLVAKPYWCSKCDYTSAKLSELRAHLSQVHSKKYNCSVCDYSTTRIKDFTRHTNVHTQMYKCTECDYTASSTSSLVDHTLVHFGDKPYRCTECNYRGAQLRELRMHLKVHLKGTKYTCTECNYITSKRSNYTRHVGVHMKKKRYEYIERYTSLQSADPKNKHKCSNTGKKLYNCNRCDFSTYELNIFRKHKIGHPLDKPNMCNEYDYTTLIESKYNLFIPECIIEVKL